MRLLKSSTQMAMFHITTVKLSTTISIVHKLMLDWQRHFVLLTWEMSGKLLLI